MKTVYFVRHGESEDNSAPIIQNGDTALNEKGFSQADAIAKRLANLEFDILIASPLLRAQQTAHIISEKTNKKIITSELFVEYRRPSEQFGLTRNDPATVKLIKSYFAALREGTTYKDGEGFQEMYDRAKKCLQYLESLPENKIVVVMHGVFLKFLCAVAIMEDSASPVICNQFTKNMFMDNTGITVLKYNNNWSLKVWNDSAHFAEY